MSEIIDVTPEPHEGDEPEKTKAELNGHQHRTQARLPGPQNIKEMLAKNKGQTVFLCAFSTSTGFEIAENKEPILRTIIQADLSHLGEEAGQVDKAEEFLVLAAASIEAIQQQAVAMYQRYKKFLDLRDFKFPQ